MIQKTSHYRQHAALSRAAPRIADPPRALARVCTVFTLRQTRPALRHNGTQRNKSAARTRALATWLGRVLRAICLALLLPMLPALGQACSGPVTLRHVAPQVWIWAGQSEDIHPVNGGHVSSSVVLLHDTHEQGRRLTVLDPGPHRRHGSALLHAIRCRWGDATLQLINSHAHAEHVLGNAAFRAADPDVPILATASTIEQMRAHCPDCLRHLEQMLGPETMRGTTIVLPDRRVVAGDRLRLTAKPWEVLEFERAHSLSDLVLWEPEHRTLIAAGLVYQRRLPVLAQGSVSGWIRALDRLLALRPNQVIAATEGDVRDIESTRAYLCDLEAVVWRGLELGQDAVAVGQLEMPRYTGWAGYRTRHTFNVQRAWRELEPLWMRGDRPACSAPDIAR